MIQHPEHQGAMRLNIMEVTRRLNDALGGTLVALLAGANHLESSYEWAEAGGRQPGAESVKRLRFAHEQWRLISAAEGSDVARGWFIGANSWLGHQTPVGAIRDGRLKEVAAAAQAFVDASFSG